MKIIPSLFVVAALILPVSAQNPGPTPAPPATTPAATAARQAEALYHQGSLAEKAGDPVTAEKSYTAALKADPTHANARYALGQLKLTSNTIAAKGREAKFATIIIPAFNLDAATLQEAIDALGVLIEKQSKNAVAPNFVIQDPQKKLSEVKISIKLKSMPAKAVLQYLLEQSGAKARYDEHAIVIMPNATLK